MVSNKPDEIGVTMLTGNFTPYMKLNGEQTHITESYVVSPPALWIIDEAGLVWTLGMEFARDVGALDPRGEFAFEVLCNGHRTGEYASRIERVGGRIRIFTHSGMKRWNGRCFI